MNTHGIPDQVTLEDANGREVVAQFQVRLDLDGNGQLGYFAEESAVGLGVWVNEWDISLAMGQLRSKMRSSTNWSIVPDWPVG